MKVRNIGVGLVIGILFLAASVIIQTGVAPVELLEKTVGVALSSGIASLLAGMGVGVLTRWRVSRNVGQKPPKEPTPSYKSKVA